MRIDTYAADLATANREQTLGLELPKDIHAQPRDEDFLKRFGSIEHARQHVEAFIGWCNGRHRSTKTSA